MADNMKDLFGSDSEEESSTPAPQKKTYNEDELFGSDSDDEPAKVEPSRLKKAKKTKEKPIKPKKRKKDSKNDATKVQLTQIGDDDSDNNEHKLKKKKKKKETDTGNAYDSGEEIVADEGDKNFLDSDDDLADIAKEYDEEKQNFNDEHDDEFDKAEEKKSSGGSASKSFLKELKNTKRNTKDMDPTDKLVIISSLFEQMDEAWRKDIECLDAQPFPKPAIYKLSLLDKVSKILNQRSLHDMLLEEGILEKIRNWLYPYPYEDKNGNELPLSKRLLPNLTLRSKLCELLLSMPITPEHLKQTELNRHGGISDKWQGLGKVILLLFKHPNETSNQKKKLSQLLEEWSRQIFKKPKDYKHLNTSLRESNHAYVPKHSSGLMLRRSDSESVDDFDSSRENRNKSIGTGGRGESIPEVTEEYQSRASRPFRIGFDFKVKPLEVDIKAAKIGKNRAKKNALSIQLKAQLNKVKMGSQRGTIPLSRVDI